MIKFYVATYQVYHGRGAHMPEELEFKTTCLATNYPWLMENARYYINQRHQGLRTSFVVTKIIERVWNTPTNYEQEDEILAQADKIRSDAFCKAEAKWVATLDIDKKRPWPRCHNITCNRTLNCLSHTGPCEGFDF